MDKMNLKKYPKPSWSKEQRIKLNSDGVVEDVCIHGLGHPNVHWLHSEDNKRKDGTYINLGNHICCGCCTDMEQN